MSIAPMKHTNCPTCTCVEPAPVSLNDATPEDWDAVNRNAVIQNEKMSTLLRTANSVADNLGAPVYIIEDDHGELAIRTGVRYREQALETINPQG